MEITYQNVASIRHAKLSLETGKLIALIGETNQGKSACFNTFVDAFTNSPDFKRWINKQALEENPNAVAKVSLVDDEGNYYTTGEDNNIVAIDTIDDRSVESLSIVSKSWLDGITDQIKEMEEAEANNSEEAVEEPEVAEENNKERTGIPTGVLPPEVSVNGVSVEEE